MSKKVANVKQRKRKKKERETKLLKFFRKSEELSRKSGSLEAELRSGSRLFHSAVLSFDLLSNTLYNSS